MQTILLVGAGRMGSAMLRGWIKTLGLGYSFIAVDPYAGPALADIGDEPADECRFRLVRSIDDLALDSPPEAIILATKPQMAVAAVQDLTDMIGPETILVSVAAGIGIETLQAPTGRPIPVIRVMPNIGALVGYSVTAGYASPETSVKQKAMVDHLFNTIGQMAWLDAEEDLHLVTAVSGSGPAYYFAFCEAMIAAAEAEGLSAQIARSLAIGTAITAGQLLANTPDPQKLRETVTSPNGTTAAGLAELTSGETLSGLIKRTINAAAQRSITLS